MEDVRVSLIGGFMVATVPLFSGETEDVILKEGALSTVAYAFKQARLQAYNEGYAHALWKIKQMLKEV